MSINRVNISGNLTRDAELRQTQSGMAVLGFGVAVSERVKNSQTGEWEDHPNFVDCTMFGTRAEKIAQYLTKGTKVAIEGKLRYSSWEKDGQKRSKLEVIVDEIEFMSSQQQSAPQYQQAPQYAPQPQYQAPQYQQQPMPQYAPQSAPQQGYAPQPQQQQMPYPNQVAYQAYQQVQQMPGAPAQGVYDEDIPF